MSLDIVDKQKENRRLHRSDTKTPHWKTDGTSTLSTGGKTIFLLLITHPRYQNRIPGVEAARRREFSYVDDDGSAARRNSSGYAFSGKAPTGPGGPKR